MKKFRDLVPGDLVWVERNEEEFKEYEVMKIEKSEKYIDDNRMILGLGTFGILDIVRIVEQSSIVYIGDKISVFSCTDSLLTNLDYRIRTSLIRSEVRKGYKYDYLEEAWELMKISDKIQEKENERYRKYSIRL